MCNPQVFLIRTSSTLRLVPERRSDRIAQFGPSRHVASLRSRFIGPALVTTALDPPAPDLDSFGESLNVAVIGASGGIGGAFVDVLADNANVNRVFALSRHGGRPEENKIARLPLDLEDEESIGRAAGAIAQAAGHLHLAIVAAGVLHDGARLQPEKTWRSLDGPAMERVFRINTIGPALVAKHLLPLLARDRKAVFAALSARVGSISDNRLGGWHAYRASKAALNMVLKTLSIELARRNPTALCVGLHPGTVDTALSEPFQSGVPRTRLFPPSVSARHLLTVLDTLTPEDSGHLYGWDGHRIPV